MAALLALTKVDANMSKTQYRSLFYTPTEFVHVHIRQTLFSNVFCNLNWLYVYKINIKVR